MRLHRRNLSSAATSALLLLAAGLIGCGSPAGGDDNWYYHWNCNGDSECLALGPGAIGQASGTINEGPVYASCSGLLEFSSRFWNMPPATDSCDHSPVTPVPPPPAPAIVSFLPGSGVPGDDITVSGSGFLAVGVPGGGPPPAGFTAQVGTVPAVVVSVSSNQVVLIVPAMPKGSYPVTIVTAGGRAVSGASYVVRDPILAVSTSGNGTVTSAPAGISCTAGGGSCSASFPHGTLVVLTATPAASAAFDGWLGGGCSGAQPGCSVALVADTAVTAAFLSQTLAVGLSGNGRVVSSPAGIDCGGGGRSCIAAFAPGTRVTLTATPGSNASFGGWTGGCAPSGTACTLTLDASATVQATFLTSSLTVLPVAVNGTAGTGTITSVPAGIDCPGTGASLPGCSASFAGGTVVELRVALAGGSTFAGWDGAGCTGVGPCTVTLTADTTVTGQYCVPHGTLTYTTPGSYAHVACAATVAVEAWAGGGGGGAEADRFGLGSGSGGGGGGYGAGSLDVAVGSAHLVTVGAGGLSGWAYDHGTPNPAQVPCSGSTRSAGGAGGASRFGALLEATGGGGGSYGPAAGGAAGTSNAPVVVNGTPGLPGGAQQNSLGGAGGSGGNGGAGGAGGVGATYDTQPPAGTSPNGTAGSPPGGGGGGGAWINFFCYEGAAGAGGKVIVTW